MPGVNLTGNSTSGQRGNNRQIDIRGMGPENTLILIDGVPVTSRNAFAIAGAANAIPGATATGYLPKWSNGLKFSAVRQPRAMVPARRAEWSISLPKRPTNTWHGSLSFFTNQPENNKEGTTNRANFNLSGPLAGEALTMRLYGNINKTEPDAWDINHAQNGSYAAGREGVRK